MGDIHTADINCLDWCKSDSNIFATGSSDKSVAIIDRRKVYRITTVAAHNEIIP
jgi:WD40 repeat protein